MVFLVAGAALLGACGTSVSITEDPVAVVDSVVVTATSVVLDVGDSASLAATPVDADGAPVADASVSWMSIPTSVATISSQGVLRGVKAGTAVVIATSEAKSTEVSVLVEDPQEDPDEDPEEDPDAVVDSVVVSPASLVLEVGGSATVSATPVDADGLPVVDASVSWVSLTPSIATVSNTGLVEAESAGIATVVASSESKSTEVVVTVNEPPVVDPDPTLANECQNADAAWIWCDDFDQDRLASYFEYNDAGGQFVREAAAGVEGSHAMRARFEQGDVTVGWLHLAFGRTPKAYFDPVDAGTADYREVYWRLYVRMEPGWTGGGGVKLSRAFSFADPDSWAQSMIAHVWSADRDSPNANYLFIDPASGTDVLGNLMTTGYNDFPNLRWLGAVRAANPTFDAANIGSWHCVEARARLNDAGASNGVFQLWIDGALEAEKTGLNWVGSFDDYGINAVFIENYWNAGSPATQDRFIDNFVVSTERIGCG